jgi:hypothetical protein
MTLDSARGCRSIDTTDMVRQRQASIEAARRALAASEAQVGRAAELLGRTGLVLARIETAQLLLRRRDPQA